MHAFLAHAAINFRDSAINEQLAFYATLETESGEPLSGTYDMVFRLYTVSTGGAPLLTFTHTAANGNPVTVTNGEFGVQLGSGTGNAIAGIDFNDNDTLYVGVTIDDGDEETPRERLAAAPYVFNADLIDGYDSTELVYNYATNTIAAASDDTILSIVQNGSGDILNLYDGGSEILTVTDGGRVGIGTSNPSYSLVVNGAAQFTGAIIDGTNSGGAASYVLQSTGSGLVWVATSTLNVSASSSPSLFTDGGVTTYLTSLTDDLLIGSSYGSLALDATSTVDFFYTVDDETSPQDIVFNDDGTKLFEVGDRLDAVRAYDLSTPYDIATAHFNGEEFSTTFTSTSSRSIAFNTSGTKMYILDDTNDETYAYDLGVAYDLSSVTYNGESLSYGFAGTCVKGMTFNDVGSQISLVTGCGDQMLYTLDLGTNFDLSTAIYNNASTSYSAVTTYDMEEIEFNDDGTKLFLNGYYRVAALDLSVPYDITTAVYNGEINSSALRYGLTLDGTGDQIYALYRGTLYQYAMSSTYDVSTLTIDEYFATGLHASNNHLGLVFNASGTQMYIHEYTTSGSWVLFELSTPFDTTSAVLDGQTVRFAEDTGIRDLRFNDDGSKLFALGNSADNVFGYDLTVPYDISTKVYSGEVFSVASADTFPIGLALSSAGDKMFVLGSNSDTVYEYTLLTPFNVSTASSTGVTLNVGEFDSSPDDIVFTSAGDYMYYLGSNTGIHLFKLGTNFDLSTAVFTDVLYDITAETLALGDSDYSLIALFASSLDKLREYYFVPAAPVYKFTVANGSMDLYGDHAGFNFDGTEFFTSSSTNGSILFGVEAGANLLASDSNNILMGYQSGFNIDTGVNTDSIFIGYQAGYDLQSTALSNTIGIGYQAAYNLDGIENIAIGPFSGYTNSGDYNVLLGYEAGYVNTGDYNNLIGYGAGYNNTGSYNNMMGLGAGANNIGDYNIFSGSSTGAYNTGTENVFLGDNAGEFNTGSNVVGFGQFAAQNNSGSFNNFIGRYAGVDNTGNFNDVIGYQAGQYLTGNRNLILGAEAYKGTASFTANNNVILGYQAGMNAETGADNNILIGYRAGDNLTTGSNNIVIGYDVDIQDPTLSNTLNISNIIFATGLTATGATISTGNVGIGTSTPTAQFTTTGSVQFQLLGAGAVQSDANGNLTVSSDERLKDVLSLYATGTDAILGIEPILYQWKKETGYDTHETYLGFSAQNIQAFIPESVGEDEKGFLTLSDRGILAVVVNSIKDAWARLVGANEHLAELQETVEQLEQASVDRKEQIAEFESLLTDYEAQLDIDYEAPEFLTASTTATSSLSAATTTPALSSDTATTTATSTVVSLNTI